MMHYAVERKRELQDAAAGLFAMEWARSCDDKIMEVNALVDEKESIQIPLPPLLRLPAEIRNQIYTLVLGTNSLHVYARNSNDAESPAKADYYTCLAPHSHHHQNSADQPEWLERHISSCFAAGSSHLPNLALMFTCRQIYTETRLLPYSTNTFTFVAPNSMQTFIESALKPDQAKALRSLSIWIAVAPTAPTAPDMVASESTDTTTTWKSWSPSPKIVDEGLMQGIQELQLAISVFDSEAADANWRDMKEVEGILRLKDLTSFKRVSVAVSQDEEGGAGSNREVVNMYAEEVKERLLGVYVPRPVVVEEE